MLRSRNHRPTGSQRKAFSSGENLPANVESRRQRTVDANCGGYPDEWFAVGDSAQRTLQNGQYHLYVSMSSFPLCSR